MNYVGKTLDLSGLERINKTKRNLPSYYILPHNHVKLSTHMEVSLYMKRLFVCGRLNTINGGTQSIKIMVSYSVVIH